MNYELIWKLLSEERITNMCCAPTVCTLLMAHEASQKLESPVRVTIAASPPSPSLFKALIEHNFAPVHVYGLTETYGPVMKGTYIKEWSEQGEARYKLMARQGHGFSTSSSAKVVKTDPSTGQLSEVRRDGSELGEIAIHGNIVMKGYFNDVEATQKTFNSEKYFMTGDLAVVHKDGSVEIQDRGKDIIISGGENISSIDTESAILQHPKVLECAVVAKKDEKWGEVPVAFVTLRSEVTVEDIFNHTKKLIAGYKRPKEIIIVQELPKTSTGKVKKNELRDRLKSASTK
jgi:acyl-CoA synthetase (AMP-forming)/AMP-acid ligase II